MLRFKTQTERGQLANGNVDRIAPFSLGTAIPDAFKAFRPDRIVYVEPNMAARNVAYDGGADAVAALAAANAVAPVGVLAANLTDQMEHMAQMALTANALDNANLFPDGLDNIGKARVAQAFTAARLGAAHAWGTNETVWDAGQCVAANVTYNIGGAGRTDPETVAASFSAPYQAAANWLERFDDSAQAQNYDHIMALIGCGLYATTGANLVKDGHNCTRQHYSYHDAVFKQFARTMTAEEYNTMTASINSDQVRDVLVHKCMHVFAPGARRDIAKEPATATRLVAMGLGSAAVRVPAISDEKAMIGAYVELVASTSVGLTAANVAYENLLADLIAEQEQLTAAEAAGTTPATLAAARRASRDRVSPKEADVAWVAGFAAAMNQQAGVDPNKVSQLRARSIQRVMKDKFTAYAQGKTHFSMSHERAERRAREGHLIGVGLGDDAAPAEITARHWSADVAAAVAPFLLGGGAGAPAPTR